MNSRIEKFMVLSTAHLSPSCLERMNEVQWGNPDSTLEPKAPTLGGIYGDYGFFLYVQEEDHAEINAEFEGLGDVFTYAASRGCWWVLLDRDEEPVDDLKVYDHK